MIRPTLINGSRSESLALNCEFSARIHNTDCFYLMFFVPDEGTGIPSRQQAFWLDERGHLDIEQGQLTMLLVYIVYLVELLKHMAVFWIIAMILILYRNNMYMNKTWYYVQIVLTKLISRMKPTWKNKLKKKIMLLKKKDIKRTNCLNYRQIRRETDWKIGQYTNRIYIKTVTNKLTYKTKDGQKVCNDIPYKNQDFFYMGPKLRQIFIYIFIEQI